MNPDQILKAISEFVVYWRLLKGDEKGEAQVFCDRLFKAFGHAGYKEAGATLEYRVKAKGKATRYADLRWPSRLLLEMKTRGEDLAVHYRQAFDYWIDMVPHRPKYVVLCNFDEFWIYDFDQQLDEPMDQVKTEELRERYTALNFLFPEEKKPLFKNDLVAVTRAAADKVASVFNSAVARGEDRANAQRFILQCVMAMFAADFGLLPKGIMTEMLNDCRMGESTFDLMGGLFRQMGIAASAKAGRFKDVPYFNGGLFAVVEPIELTVPEIELLISADSENWSKVKPPIFGTLFQNSMERKERHALGAHFTSEADITRVVSATVERPWRERLQSAATLKELLTLRDDLLQFRVLDPACGSGNFLYLSYLQLRRVENDLLKKLHSLYKKAPAKVGTTSLVSLHQFRGIDRYAFAVELAKVTMLLAKEIALRETVATLEAEQIDLPLVLDKPLPLDNLDSNFQCDDALFCKWPQSQAIIGNPPYQSKNKMQQEFGPAYVQKVRARYPDVPGRADYCVYWFRRAHDELAPEGRAGLVGTNTIRQNYSRQGGLDYIVNNGGTITEAVSTQVWSGDAKVHVSIVNWIKGKHSGSKKLYTQLGDRPNSPWWMEFLPKINSALSGEADVSNCYRLNVNIAFDGCDQGQTHGHKGFLLSPTNAAALIGKGPSNSQVIFPFLIADELLGFNPPFPQRFVIDFHPRDVVQASRFAEPFEIVKTKVLPDRNQAYEKEQKRNQEVLDTDPNAKVNHHHENFLKRWWLLSYARAELINKLGLLPRYVVCARVTKRPIFEFVSSSIRPNDALQVFVVTDDYSFGILQSSVHWHWFNARCSTLKGDFRYTS